MGESTQQKLSRVRPPRVQITYDVETGGAVEARELPFIIGVMADLTGKPSEAVVPLKDRKFVEIDPDNFNDVLSAASPRVAFRVPNKLRKDSNEQVSIDLTFRHIDDFEPVEVMERIPAMKSLMDARKRLRDLLTKLDGNDSLDALLTQVLKSTEEQATLKKQLEPSA